MSVARLDTQLCFAVYAASHQLSSIYRSLLEPLDLTYTQFIVLMALWEEDDISISQLAEKAELTKATMTPLLKRLEEKGFIRREVPSDNERQKNVVLTESGRSLSRQSGAITRKAFIQTGLSESEAKQLMALCKKIAR